MDARLDRRHPELENQLETSLRRVAVRDGGGAGLEAARVRRGIVVEHVHCERVRLREPAGLRRQQRIDQVAPHVQVADAGRAEQVLDHAADREVDIECPYIELERTRCLEAIEQHPGAARMRDSHDAGHVEAAAVAVADLGYRDKPGALVDHAFECSSGIVP